MRKFDKRDENTLITVSRANDSKAMMPLDYLSAFELVIAEVYE